MTAGFQIVLHKLLHTMPYYYALPPVWYLPPVQQSQILTVVTLLSSDSTQIQHRQVT